MPKASTSTGYIFILYGGYFIKTGHLRTGFFTGGKIEEQLESFKEHYGNSVKGRWTKSSTPEDHFNALHEVLKEHSDGKGIYDTNVSQAVTALRDVTGATQIKTWNVYSGTNDEEEKGQNSDDVEEKKSTKKTKKAVKVETDEEAEDEAEDDAEDDAENDAEDDAEDDDEDDAEEKPAKKTTTKKTNLTPVKKTPAKKATKKDEKDEKDDVEESKPAKKAAPKKAAPKKATK